MYSAEGVINFISSILLSRRVISMICKQFMKMQKKILVNKISKNKTISTLFDREIRHRGSRNIKVLKITGPWTRISRSWIVFNLIFHSLNEAKISKSSWLKNQLAIFYVFRFKCHEKGSGSNNDYHGESWRKDGVTKLMVFHAALF